MEATSVGINYIFGSYDEKFLKIGFSDDVDGLSRLHQHMKKSPFSEREKPTLIALWRGRLEDEKAIHRYFPAYLAREVFPHDKEIFCSSLIDGDIRGPAGRNQLMDWIAWMLERSHVAATDIEFRTTCRNRIVPACDWLPNSRNISSKRYWQTSLHDETTGPWSRVFEGKTFDPDDYFTDMALVNLVREFIGGIDLDPASHILANAQIKATVFYTEQTDGLKQSWAKPDGTPSRVWLSPTFDQWPLWVDKALQELAVGHVHELIAIVGARQSTTKGFELLLDRADAECTLNHKIVWWGKKQDDNSVSTEGHRLIFISANRDPERIAAFAKFFRSQGVTWPKV